MANKLNDKDIVIKQLNIRPPKRGSLDIKQFRDALKQWESTKPNRVKLLDMFTDLLVDSRVTSLIEKRIDAILNLELKFFNDNNEEVYEITDLINTSYFEDALKSIIESKFFGYSLSQLDWSTDVNYNNTTYEVDRRHVRPELGIVVKDPSDTTGVDFLEHPYALFTNTKRHGLLMPACALVIYKRNNTADWAENNETFGMPYPHGTYENGETADLLTEAFEKAGFDRFIVAPSDANIELHQNPQSGGYDNFQGFKKANDEDLSILFLGQTLTTEVSGNGSYAASKTHSKVEDDLHKADRKFVLKKLNEKLIPILERIGYKVDGRFEFVFSNSLSLSERIAIDTQVAQIVPISNDYFYETYNIPKPTTDDTVKGDKEKPIIDEKELSASELGLFNKFLNLFNKKKSKVLEF